MTGVGYPITKTDASVQVARWTAGANATWRTDMQQECRCCGKFVPGWYAYGDNSEFNIHTMCIAKHWGKHARGVNRSRCKEFKKK